MVMENKALLSGPLCQDITGPQAMSARVLVQMRRCDEQGGEVQPQEAERCGAVVSSSQPGPGVVATTGKEGMGRGSLLSSSSAKQTPRTDV